MKRWLGLLLAPFACALVGSAHESPVDHVDRTIQMWVEDGELHVSYRILLPERAVLVQLNRMDTDGDGVISPREREVYFQAFADRIAPLLRVELDGRPLALQPDGPVALDPQLGETFVFSTPLGHLAVGTHRGRLRDLYSQAYPGPYRLKASPQVAPQVLAVTVTEAPETQHLAEHAGMIVLDFELKAAAAGAETKSPAVQTR